ncbi:hypothetical protein COB64_02955 [Candidatus Wolfebacteria bacterium]|nr:MAG: hypothetical protein COB64_02955 [Candidatus Wolfebacteria bacterium]
MKKDAIVILGIIVVVVVFIKGPDFFKVEKTDAFVGDQPITGTMQSDNIFHINNIEEETTFAKPESHVRRGTFKSTGSGTFESTGSGIFDSTGSGIFDSTSNGVFNR